MADRATTLTGSFQKVTLGATSKILGAGTYEISGATRRTVDVSEYGVDCDIFEFGGANGGTITLNNVSFDKADPMQLYLISCVEQGIKLEGGYGNTSGMHFWLNTSSCMVCGTSGNILMTTAGQVTSDRNGTAKTSFTGQISGAFMIVH